MNDLYDPEADAVHDHHAAEREQIAELLRDYGPRGVTGRRARSKLQAALDAHHLACLRTHKTRHATVEDYARWRFQHWRGSEAPVVDYEALGSVEETDQLYVRLQAEVRAARLSGLPVGQPPGLTAFSGGDLQFWRCCKAGELPSGSPHAGRGMRVRALVTVSWRDGLWHVCFMRDWTHVGVGVSEVFEDLANSTYQHALVLAGLQVALPAGVRGWLGRLVPHGLRSAALCPDSFRFYEHQPPRWRAAEEFSLVRMRFRHGRFGSPCREPYTLIPASLASVRRAASRDTKPRIEDVFPQLPQAGGDSSAGRPSPSPVEGGGQASKGVARRSWRVMAEPVLIAVAALAGALIGAFYHPGYGNPMLGAAGATASLATSFGLVWFVSRSYGAGTKVLGGIVLRVAVTLLCLVIGISGFACVCDDVSQAVYLPAITFE